MESITIKIEESIVKEMDSNLKKHRYSTRTEFIREAIRDKLSTLEKENLKEELKKYLGASKTKTTYKKERKIREEVGKEFAKKFLD